MSATYAHTSTGMLLALLDIPHLLSKPAIVAVLASRGVERRVTQRRTGSRADAGRRATDAPRVARDCVCGMRH